jgi:hypothetical protein
LIAAAQRVASLQRSKVAGSSSSRAASRKRVENRKHFNHPMTKYLVAHRGVKWFEDRGRVGVVGAKKNRESVEISRFLFDSRFTCDALRRGYQ